MPRFDFKCTACGNIQEEVVFGGASGKKAACSKCGGLSKWKPTWCGGFKILFRDGYDLCTDTYHPTKKHYEEHLRANNLVKVE